MKFLSLDTSTKYSVVALSDEGGLIYGCRRLSEKGRSDALVGLIGHCLQKTKTKIQKIDYFGVGIGPGSFTGLRIGLSAAKGFAYAGGKPCLAFSSLDAIAFNLAPYKTSQLAVIVDARRSNVYAQFYRRDPREPSALKTIRTTSKDSLLAFSALSKMAEGDFTFSGDALNLYRGELQKRGITSNRFTPERFWYPTPESISRLTLRSFESGKDVDCFKLGAVYLYPQDCQVSKRC